MKKFRQIASLITVILFCFAVLFGGAYLYLDHQFDRSAAADNSAGSVPYASAPEDCGLLFRLPDGVLFLQLDFSARRTVALLAGENSVRELRRRGYLADHTLTADYRLIEGMIDRIGGIELDTGGETLRYTGVQVVDLLSAEPDPLPLRERICTAVLARIAEKGITRQEFVYLIEQSETDLTVPDCWFWADEAASLCENAQVIVITDHFEQDKF